MTGRAERAIGINFALFCTLTIAVTLTPYSVDAFLPAFPDARVALGTSAITMQLTMSVFLIGVALGQLIFGPLSDRLGRRGPLIWGTAICTVAAIACAMAPDVTALLVARFVQGLAGSASMVVTKAIIRDRTVGRNTVQVLSLTAVCGGVLNIFAPIIGGLLLSEFGWRGPLWFIAACAVVLLILTIALVPETHPLERRDVGERWHGFRSVGRHLRNRSFLVFVIAQAGSYGTLIAYVAASPFVYQNVLGFDVVTFGFLFALNNALGVVLNFVANRFLKSMGSRKLAAAGLAGSLVGTMLTAVAWSLGAPVWVVACCITVSMATIGLNGPNLVGLALNQVTTSTGSAAATIGFVQFCVGSLVSPLVGLGGSSTLFPMSIAMAVLAGGSLLVLVMMPRKPGSRATQR